MNYGITKEQQALKDRMRDLFTGDFASATSTLDRASSPEEIDGIMKAKIKKLADEGYLGLGHAGMYGGTDEDMVGLSVAGEELARACPSTFYSVHVSTWLVGSVLALSGSEGLKSKYLPGIISGEKIGSIAPSTLGETPGISAEKKGNRWILNGTAPAMINAPIADICIIMAHTGNDSGRDGEITAFLVEKDAQGMLIKRRYNQAGFRGVAMADVCLDNSEVSEENIIGTVGTGAELIKLLSPRHHLGLAMCSLGIARACMEETRLCLEGEAAAGLSQSMSFKLADMMIMTDIARLLEHKAAWAMDNNDSEAAVLASCARVFAGESAVAISGWLVDILGSESYEQGSVAERLYRDAKFAEIAGGKIENLRDFIGINVLDRFQN